MFGSRPAFCDEVRVDKAEVPGPLLRVIECGFHPYS